jgi:OmpA-OmpF porin, OOP family
MRITFIRKHTALAAACALALGVFSATATAQIADIASIDNKQRVVDTQGAVVMSGSGQCWHTGYGPAPSWTAACGGLRPVAVVAPAPAPAAAAPVVAAPVVMAAAAPLPVAEKVRVDANILFDSDKSAIRPADRDKLDKFVAGLRGLDSQNITVTGHADRMGSDASNQALSQRRVDAVKAYLVGKGVASNRVQTSARGETQPTTAAGECKDGKNATNVACLQPDRHVSIEVSGTRTVN